MVHDAVAEPVFRQSKGLETTTSIEYLTETPYHSENDQVLHEPLLINDRAYDYDSDYYYDDYYYDDEIFADNLRNDTSDQRTPRTPRSFDEKPRIGRRILSAGKQFPVFPIKLEKNC